ncbi:MAG: hypothetical protein IKH33_07140 [Bacteroidales bacterium]|nr:hypothetical protein [Bacteroidales bacterium]
MDGETATTDLEVGRQDTQHVFRCCAMVCVRASMPAHFLYNKADNNATKSKVGRFAS